MYRITETCQPVKDVCITPNQNAIQFGGASFDRCNVSTTNGTLISMCNNSNGIVKSICQRRTHWSIVSIDERECIPFWCYFMWFGRVLAKLLYSLRLAYLLYSVTIVPPSPVETTSSGFFCYLPYTLTCLCFGKMKCRLNGVRVLYSHSQFSTI